MGKTYRPLTTTVNGNVPAKTMAGDLVRDHRINLRRLPERSALHPAGDQEHWARSLGQTSITDKPHAGVAPDSHARHESRRRSHR
jgi:hypothetical protein